MGKHSLCIKDNSQQFYFEHRCELESILWLWPRKKTHHLSDRSWKPEMGVLQFHMSQLQISEVSEKPGPQKVWGDPRGGLGSSLPVHSTLSQPAGEMVMGWFPSADSWGHSTNSQGGLFLYHPYHMLTALYLLVLQSWCQYKNLFFPPDFSWKKYKFQVVNHSLSQGMWFLGRAPAWTPCGDSRGTFWGSCFTLKLCCPLPLSWSTSWPASDTFGSLKKK